MTDRAAVGRMSRRKGSRAERKIAQKIAESIGLPGEVRRTPGSGAHIERGDLRFSEKAQALFPFFVEVKAREGWHFWQVFSNWTTWGPRKWFLNAETARDAEEEVGFTGGPKYPVVLILLQNRKKPLVMFRFMELCPPLDDGWDERAFFGPFVVTPLDTFLARRSPL